MAADAYAMFAFAGRTALRAPQRSRIFSQKDRLLQSYTKIDTGSDRNDIYCRLQDIEKAIGTHIKSCVVCYTRLESTAKRYEALKAPSILERLPVLGEHIYQWRANRQSDFIMAIAYCDEQLEESIKAIDELYEEKYALIDQLKKIDSE